jgi:hypothetical protein
MPKHGSKHHPVEGHSDPICALVEELNEAAKALYDARVALDKANVHHAAMLRRVSVAQLGARPDRHRGRAFVAR